MTSISTNTAMAAAQSKGGRLAGGKERSPTGATLPRVGLDDATVALITENEGMLQCIATLQHEVDKQKERLDAAREERESLVYEVAELRSQLGLAVSEATLSSGKVINYKTEYENLLVAFDAVTRDRDANKAQIDAATKWEKQQMQQQAPSTARDRGHARELPLTLSAALKMPNMLAGRAESVSAKLLDPALRPADRHSKMHKDVEGLEASVRQYKSAREYTTAVTADGEPPADLQIRQCVVVLLDILVKLLKDAVTR
ncbi:hypothetical protein NESM_000836600 [Novymonas esmeraldas]|uniref:Uncharacterized protein n=1 Tax=Novymonas esmeraldas TaxID=1808958 RepID=A0AAW0F084_9TRYP